MEYISKIDNKSFTSKESLVEHLLENYAFVAEESDFKSIFDKIKKAVPHVQVESISKDAKGMVNIQLLFYNREGELLTGDSIYIGKSEDSHYYGENMFDTTDKVIQWIASFYERSDDIEELITTKFKGASYLFNSLYTGNYDNYGIIYFTFEADGVTHTFHHDVSDTMKQLENQLSALFSTKIEGVVEKWWDHSSNHQVFRLDGVDIQKFLNDGDHVVIDITERKNNTVS